MSEASERVIQLAVHLLCYAEATGETMIGSCNDFGIYTSRDEAYRLTCAAREASPRGDRLYAAELLLTGWLP